MEQQPTKKRRGRPLKESDEDQSAVGQRRARVRQAQRDFRRRKEETVTELRARITMLEDTVEEMSTTFVGLSDSILGSEYIQSHPQLIASIGDAVKRVLKLAENATRDPDEKTGAPDDDLEPPQDQPRDLLQSELADDVPIAPSQGDTTTAPRYLTTNEMGMQRSRTEPLTDAGPGAEAGPGERNPVPENVRGMVTQNTFFTQEFWGGDDTTSADMHMLKKPNRPLPFWERLLRLNPTSVIHRLTRDGMRGEADFCMRWEARGFKYSLKHKSKTNILARTRRVVDNIAAHDACLDATERGLPGPKLMQADWRPRVEAYFDNDDLRTFGAATRHSMLLAGYPVENHVNAEEVEDYLKEKRLTPISDDEVEMELSIPAPFPWTTDLSSNRRINDELQPPPARSFSWSRRVEPNAGSRSSSNRQGRPQKRIVALSLTKLIESFTDLSICTGNWIGYPKNMLNMAVVASVIRIGD